MKARIPKGFGKQNLNNMMQQAQQMQQQLEVKQAELEETEYTVSGSGDLVEITIMGSYDVTAVRIKPELVQEDDIEMLEDILGAAFNDAVRTVKEAAEKEMGEISGGLDIPGLNL